MRPIQQTSVFLWEYAVEAVETVWVKGIVRVIEGQGESTER
jgi:hypothetical protein